MAKVLIVDDEQDICEITSFYLKVMDMRLSLHLMRTTVLKRLKPSCRT